MIGNSSILEGTGRVKVVVQTVAHEKLVADSKTGFWCQRWAIFFAFCFCNGSCETNYFFENNSCSVFQRNKCNAQGSLCSMHYYLNTANTETNFASEVALFAGLKRLHERLGYEHIEALCNICCQQVAEGLQINSDKVSEKCVACLFCRSSLLHISKIDETCSNRVMLLIHWNYGMNQICSCAHQDSMSVLLITVSDITRFTRLTKNQQFMKPLKTWLPCPVANQNKK